MYTYESKRAKGMYNLFKEQLEKVKLVEDRNKRVQFFLECIECSNADDILVEAIENMDRELEAKKSAINTMPELAVTMSKLQKHSTRSTYEWNEYFVVMKNIFKEWKYSRKMKELFGVNCGTTDIVRLYLYCVTH